METVIKLIREKDWKKILAWATTLTEQQRIEYLEKVHQIQVDTDLMTIPRPENYDRSYYELYGLYSELLSYAQLICMRNEKELKAYSNDWENGYSAFHGLLYATHLDSEPLVAYYSLYPADYLTKEINKHNIRFYSLWKFCEKGWIPFDEKQFVHSLFTLFWSKDRSLKKDIEFLTAHPETIEKVLLQFYKYPQIPVLDIAAWDGLTERCHGKGTGYWEEAFTELLNRKIITDRKIVLNLIDGLANDWKKGHIDWFIRLIRIFGPTTKELLTYQSNLFAALHSKNSSVTNFVVECVTKIISEKEFNTELFLQSVPLILSKEKCDKSILTVFKLIDKLLTANPANHGYAADIATALIQPNEKIQQVAARLLLKYIDPQELTGLVTPYIPQLRKETQDILQVESIVDEEINMAEITYEKLTVPNTWEDLLFHLGKTVKGQNAADIDLFFDSLIRLQDQLPDNHQKQIKPLIKSLSRKWTDNPLNVYLGEFFDNWINPQNKYIHSPLDKDHRFTSELYPFIRHRNQWVLNRLKRKVTLSFLSTPTHSPCYVAPATLVNRLLDHEKADESVEPEDLLIACSRILPGEITSATKEAAQKLKGGYKDVIYYLLGISDKIQLTDPTMPLWAQATRTRNPEGVFLEFEKTELSKYPAVMMPFDITYKIIKRTCSDGIYTWYSLNREYQTLKKWSKEMNRSETLFPLYLYGSSSQHLSSQVALYHLSLVPHYPDVYLVEFVKWISDEMYGVDKLIWMIENHIKVHHGGWLFIAACLVSKDKPTRQAAADYITLAINEGFIKPDYVAGYISTLVTDRYAPVNRLIEYFNIPAGKQSKAFQLCIVEQCIQRAQKGELPTGFKKLFTWYSDLTDTLNINPEPEIEIKIKSLNSK